jgi:hypothetical protein
MAIKTSTALRRHMLVDGAFIAALDGGRLRIFSGAVPATADAAETGTLLAELTVGGDGATGLTFDAAAATTSIAKTTGESWGEDSILASGTASYYRFVADGDSGGVSTTEARVQGTAGGLGGEDLFLIEPDLVAGQPFVLEFYRIAFPTA